MCLNRLDSLEKHLKRQQISDDCNEIFVDYERKGIVEKVSNAEDEGTVHYFPHRPAIREDKSTTKIRAVFDASCSVNGVLNDCLARAGETGEPCPPPHIFQSKIKFKQLYRFGTPTLKTVSLALLPWSKPSG